MAASSKNPALGANMNRFNSMQMIHSSSLHLTTFCLQYKPTVIACVCIHLACKWSNWEIPVSTDGKHWWVYVDNTVTLELLDELTHEFLQILEKTPSRLKRIRNWRATQASKKPKTDSSQLIDTSFSGPSLLQDQCETALSGGSSSNVSFSKGGLTFTASIPRDSSMTLDSMTGTYNPGSHSEWPQVKQSQVGYPPICVKQEPIEIPHQEPTLSLQTSTSSLLQNPTTYRIDKALDFIPFTQEPKEAGGVGLGKHQPPPPQSTYHPSAQPPPPSPSPAQKLSLDKYREKVAAEISVSGQKCRQDQHGASVDCDVKAELSSSSSVSSYGPISMSHVDHRKHPQSNQLPYTGTGGTTVSPMKIKVPSSSTAGVGRCYHNDKQDKAMPKLRLALPGGSQLDKSGQPSKDELKMKIKVSSSDCHASADKGMLVNNKSKNSVGKDKNRGAEHHPHRHHKHAHSHSHSGNGRGGPELQGGVGGHLRGAPGLISMEGVSHAPGPGSISLSASSSRKRPYPEVSYNHQFSSSSSTSSSKTSKITKGGPGAAGGLRTSQQYPPPCASPHEAGEQRH